jgi:hypothetical protein
VIRARTANGIDQVNPSFTTQVPEPSGTASPLPPTKTPRTGGLSPQDHMLNPGLWPQRCLALLTPDENAPHGRPVH